MTDDVVITLEEAILRLQRYWREEGCLVWQPINTEVGAGTMNPATFLRALGPDPWRVAYVEPSVRPDDSRYGQNPNRMQTHTQFQVLLKPDTGHPIEQYLKSLQVLGIDPARNDVRFVEDNWESPALGAWGLGWEVWLNGLEITQFTYFQQAGGHTLDPVSVEITYGLERILMALQQKVHFKDIEYAEGIRYGDLLGRSELEMSTYYLDVADIDRTRELFKLYEAEAKYILERELVLPAYQYILKLSQLFNVLDARGAVGVAERAGFFHRMRELSQACADLWLEKSQPARWPSTWQPAVAKSAVETARTSDAPASAAPLVVEVGVEEMPPRDVETAIDVLERAIPDMLSRARLSHGAVQVRATPRRLVVLLEDLADRQPRLDRLVRGPRVSVAFDADGGPTAAAEGFARRNGVSVAELDRDHEGDQAFIAARVTDEGRRAVDVLAQELPNVLGKLRFQRGMRWNETGISFSRPIRWLVALHGAEVVPMSFAGVSAGRSTQLLRGAADAVELSHAAEYVAALEGAGIEIDREQRRERIWSSAVDLAGETDGHLDSDYRTTLLPEVADLVEAPRVLLGRFEERFLALPAEVLATVMVKHQRYFPTTDGHKVLPSFVFVANGQIDDDLVRAGNEAVIRARYADAEFFWKHDLQRSLAEFRPELRRLTFHEKLGSMLEKAERMQELARWLSAELHLAADQAATIDRAAHLAKCDLATSMVTELSGLAGVMGGYYAQRSGEDELVALAVRDHVRPTSASDERAIGLAGGIVGLADRLDSLVGLIGAGVKPRSNADPYGLRRAAYGIIQILRQHDLALDLAEAIDVAARHQPIDVSPTVREEVFDFVLRRLEVWLRDAGYAADVARAVVGGRSCSISSKIRVAEELQLRIADPQFLSFYTVWQRCANLGQRAPQSRDVVEDLLASPAERELWRAYLEVRAETSTLPSIAPVVSAFSKLTEPVERLFVNVLIVDDDEHATQNRLALLASIAELPEDLIDPSELGSSVSRDAVAEHPATEGPGNASGVTMKSPRRATTR